MSGPDMSKLHRQRCLLPGSVLQPLWLRPLHLRHIRNLHLRWRESESDWVQCVVGILCAIKSNCPALITHVHSSLCTTSQAFVRPFVQGIMSTTCYTWQSFDRCLKHSACTRKRATHANVCQRTVLGVRLLQECVVDEQHA